jgi:hypothetical protein
MQNDWREELLLGTTRSFRQPDNTIIAGLLAG